MKFFVGIVCAVLVTSCAATVPATDELIDARQAYSRMSASSAAQIAPGELQKARDALAYAEKSFLSDPHSNRTRDLANFARHQAHQVETFTRTASDNAITADAIKVVQKPIVRP